MKIKRMKTSKKRVVIVATVILLISALCVFALLWIFRDTFDNPKPVNTIDYNPPKSAQKSAGSRAREEFEDKETEASRQSNPPQSSPQDTKVDVALQITSAAVSNDTLGVRVIVQTVDPSGTCNLTLSHNDTKIVRQSTTQTMGSYSVCRGFDLPTSSLDKGVWQMSIHYSGSENRSGFTAQEVSI